MRLPDWLTMHKQINTYNATAMHYAASAGASCTFDPFEIPMLVHQSSTQIFRPERNVILLMGSR